MGRKKDMLIKSIVFGGRDNLARIIIEQIEKAKGKQKVSEEVRKAIITHFSNKPEFREIKIKALRERRKLLKKELKEKARTIRENEEELNKLGYELKDLE